MASTHPATGVQELLQSPAALLCNHTRKNTRFCIKHDSTKAVVESRGSSEVFVSVLLKKERKKKKVLNMH